MAKKKKDTSHIVYRNSNLFCSHCGEFYIIKYPIAIDSMTKTTDVFLSVHADCEKTWEQQYPDMSLNTRQRAEFWVEHGEHGVSSKTILKTIMPEVKQNINSAGFPHDPDDFRRCYMLLKMVPELREKLHLMKETPYGVVWGKLVDNWDKLTSMLEELMETKKDNGMYDLMKQLGC